eukprot:gene7436-15212_t
MFKLISSTALLVSICLSPAVNADFTAIAGYLPLNDVTEHKKIDLDMLKVSTAVSASNFTAANYWYTVGGNSKKSTSTRTIAKFSTEASTSLAGEKWYEVYKAYWKDASYANTFTSNACNGKGAFSPSTNPVIGTTARGEGCKKGAQYQVILMYVIHEMEAAIKDCKNKIVGLHWDEAVAFYVGSIPGADGVASGQLQYTLAEKRCENFGTCYKPTDVVSYLSAVNNNVFELFERGQDYSVSLSCTDLEVTKEDIVEQFMVPLLQGTLRYLYLANTQGTEAQRAELWGFAAAVLPYVDYYSPTVAKKLYDNSNILNTKPVPDGYAEVKYALETIYSNMGITCADIGGLVSTAYSTGYIPGMAPCNSGASITSSSKKSEAIPDYGIALLVIFFVFGLIGLIVGLVFYCRVRNVYQKSPDGILPK